jgi:hypothetical protein
MPSMLSLALYKACNAWLPAKIHSHLLATASRFSDSRYLWWYITRNKNYLQYKYMPLSPSIGRTHEYLVVVACDGELLDSLGVDNWHKSVLGKKCCSVSCSKNGRSHQLVVGEGRDAANRPMGASPVRTIVCSKEKSTLSLSLSVSVSLVFLFRDVEYSYFSKYSKMDSPSGLISLDRMGT